MNTSYLKASVGTLMAFAALMWVTAAPDAGADDFSHEIVPLADVDSEVLQEHGSSTRFFYPIKPPKDKASKESPKLLLSAEI